MGKGKGKHRSRQAPPTVVQPTPATSVQPPSAAAIQPSSSGNETSVQSHMRMLHKATKANDWKRVKELVLKFRSDYPDNAVYHFTYGMSCRNMLIANEELRDPSISPLAAESLESSGKGKKPLQSSGKGKNSIELSEKDKRSLLKVATAGLKKATELKPRDFEYAMAYLDLLFKREDYAGYAGECKRSQRICVDLHESATSNEERLYKLMKFNRSLTTKAPAPFEIQKLVMVVGIDESQHSKYALEWILENFFSKPPGNSPFKLVLVEAIPPAIGQDGPGGVDNQLFVDVAEQLCRKKLVNDVKLEKKEGDPRYVLCEAVEDHHASILVIGSHGSGPIQRATLGSVSEYCAHHAPNCTVMIVKQPKSE